jgi:hypothetical protein
MSYYLSTSNQLNNTVNFDSLSTGITQLSNSYNHVGFPMYKYLVTGAYDIFKQRTLLESRFERRFLSNHIRFVVGFNECELEPSYCME